MDTKTLIIHKPEWRCHHGKNSARPVHKRMILPSMDGHPVKRVKFATEVNHDQTGKSEQFTETLFETVQR